MAKLQLPSALTFFIFFIPIGLIIWLLPKFLSVIAYGQDVIINLLIIGLGNLFSPWVVQYCLILTTLYFGLLVYKFLNHILNNF